MNFKSGVKGRGSDRWWERRWWLWWGDMRRMRWTRRTVNTTRLTEWRRELIPQVRWCISEGAVGDLQNSTKSTKFLWFLAHINYAKQHWRDGISDERERWREMEQQWHAMEDCSTDVRTGNALSPLLIMDIPSDNNPSRAQSLYITTHCQTPIFCIVSKVEKRYI